MPKLGGNRFAAIFLSQLLPCSDVYFDTEIQPFSQELSLHQNYWVKVLPRRHFRSKIEVRQRQGNFLFRYHPDVW